MFLVPLALIALCYGLYYYFTRTFDYWKKRKVAGPEPMVFFGNLFESFMRKKVMGQVIKEVYDNYPNEKVVGIYRMVTPTLLIRDLDIVKQIMIKDFDLFTERGIELSKDGLGFNLFHADGDDWRVLRNRFTPLFTSGKLKNMSYLMTEQADFFIDHVKKVVSQQAEINVHKLVQTYTMTTIASCAFGVQMDFEKDDAIMQQIITFDKLIFETNYFNELDMMYPGILRKLNSSLFPKAVSKFFNDLVTKIIVDRNGAPIGRKDFMDLILELRQQGEIKGMRRSDEKELQLEMSENVIAAQAFVFYVAGYETSATTMTFMLYELARNQDIQDKLIAEIDEVLEKYDGKVSYDSINELNYMEKVFDETLRIYPVVDTLQRKAEMDYKFPDLDLEIQKGQILLVSPMAIHHDAEHYPEPEQFDPERFSPENVRDRHPCAYIPFGIGPRNCIGMRFSKVQSRICIMSLLSKFRVEMSVSTPREVQLDPLRVVTSPRGGMFLKLVPRS